MRVFVMMVWMLATIGSVMAQPIGRYGGGPGDGFAVGESINIVLSKQEVHSHKPKIAIYPNPVPKNASVLYLTGQLKGNITITWYSITGAALYTELPKKVFSGFAITLPALASGVYMLALKEETTGVRFQKVVVQ